MHDTVTAEVSQALTVLHIPVALPADGRPSMDRPAFPDDLAPLFEETSGQRNYLVLDASARARVKGTFDLDTLDPGLNAKSLFLNEAAMDPAAPWLLDLSTPGTGRDRFLRDFFASQWGKGTGIFLRSKAPYQAVFDHLRSLLMVRSGKGENALIYFRFWDPATAVIYLAGVHARADRVGPLFHTKAHDPITMIIEDGPGKALILSPTPGKPASVTRPLQLDAADHALFNRIALARVVSDLAAWLARDYADRFAPGDPDVHRRFALHVVRHGKHFGFTLRNEYAYLAHMMLFFGGWFSAQGLFPKSDAILAAGGSRLHKALKSVFISDWQQSHLPAVAARRASLLEAVRALPGAPRVQPATLRAFVEMQFAEDPAPVWRLMAAVQRDFDRAGIAPEDRTAVGLLSVFLGLRFYDDPLHPWASQPDSASDRVSTICDTAWAHLTEDRA